MDRYARQALIGGWDQQTLALATLVVAGQGWTGFLAALMAAALGFGRIVVVGRGESGGSGEPGLARLVAGPRAAWCGFLSKVNPDVRLIPGERDLSPRLLARLRPDALIVADARRPAVTLAARAAAAGLPVACGWAAGGLGFWGAPQADRVTDRLASAEPSPVLAQLVAALLVEEVRKALLPLPDEQGPAASRQLLVPDRLAGEARPERCPSSGVARGDLSVVGAGALGTWFALACGLAGLRRQVHLYDGDDVEETNLNRQVLFFGAVGRPKATILATRLQRLFPRTRWSGYGMRVDANTHPHVDPTSVLVACPDSFQVRGFLNDLARYRRQPLLNGGTSAAGGAVSGYVPGVSPCLSCLMNIDRLVRAEAEPRPCAQVADASVVTSNAVAGALMAWLLGEMAAGRARRGIWEYDGRPREVRLGVHSRRPGCQCHLGG